MIPIKLSLQGVYSYQNLVEIDFTQLMEDRLFGIFGPVGSGKSAILEAICFALYGKVERLDTSGRNYNMMNLRSDRLLIEFEFAVGEGENKKAYKFKVTGRRNSKNFEDVNTLKRSAYEWEAKGKTGDWLPMESADATRVLGLTYEHFSKTIIIPQGKFQEFLHMTAGQRTSMLQDLFGLNRFDLAGPAGSLRKAAESQLTDLQGEVRGLGEVDLEKFREKGTEIERIQKDLQLLEAGLKADMAKEQALQQAKGHLDNFNEAKEALDFLESSTQDFENRRQTLERYTKADRYFREKLEQQGLRQKELAQARIAEQTLEKNLSEQEQVQQKLQASFVEVQKAYEKKEELKERSQEMEKLATVLVIDQEIKHSNQRLVKGKSLVDAQLEKQEQARKQAASLQENLTESRAALPDPNQLADLQLWFQRKADLAKRQQELQATLENRSAELTACEAKIGTLSWPQSLTQTTNLEAALAAVPDLQRSLTEQSQTESQLLVQAKTELRLVEFADELSPGNPCPLCGATDHPQPIQAEGRNLAVVEVEKRIDALQSERTALDQWLLKATRINEQRSNFLRSQKDVQSQLEAHNEVVKSHRASFAWPDFAPEKPELLEKALDAQKRLQTQLKQLEIDLQTARTTVDKTQQDLDAYRQELQKIDHEVQQKQSRRLTLLEQLQHFSYDNHQGKRPEELTAKADFFKEQYETVNDRYQKVNQELTELKEAIGILKTDLQVSKSQISGLSQEIIQLQTELEERLEAQEFDGLETVKALLESALDKASEDQAIRDFDEKLANLRHEITSLKAKMETQPYDKADHETFIALVSKQQIQQKELRESLGSKQAQLADMQKRIEQVAVLLKQIDALERRKSNLDLMAKLFRDKGFVKYVSSIYLIELSKRANERFLVLTRNQLSLEVQGENEFILRDMLNGGKTRSVKTLSGGQTFQAALCLALALSENIQQNTPGNSNFFFLDEGFGTLDRDALRIVFDTLKQLRREQRIVGIISHVEDLQQEIGMHLRIHKDDEKGSQVRGSWQ